MMARLRRVEYRVICGVAKDKGTILICINYIPKKEVGWALRALSLMLAVLVSHAGHRFKGIDVEAGKHKSNCRMSRLIVGDPKNLRFLTSGMRRTPYHSAISGRLRCCSCRRSELGVVSSRRSALATAKMSPPAACCAKYSVPLEWSAMRFCERTGCSAAEPSGGFMERPRVGGSMVESATQARRNEAMPRRTCPSATTHLCPTHHAST